MKQPTSRRAIPVATGCGKPTAGECGGDAAADGRRQQAVVRAERGECTMDRGVFMCGFHGWWKVPLLEDSYTINVDP